jgi:hypothetical protein
MKGRTDRTQIRIYIIVYYISDRGGDYDYLLAISITFFLHRMIRAIRGCNILMRCWHTSAYHLPHNRVERGAGDRITT